MAYAVSKLLGALLLALTVVGGPLAAGSLSSTTPAEFSSAAGQAGVINRASKSDRAASSSQISGKPALIVQVESLQQTSVAIKPEPLRRKEARDGMLRSEQVKRTVACEPAVSVLTEVARLMEPGRCVT